MILTKALRINLFEDNDVTDLELARLTPLFIRSVRCSSDNSGSRSIRLTEQPELNLVANVRLHSFD